MVDDQTQDPKGQEQQDQSTSDVEFKTRLADMQKELNKSQSEARKNQTRADRAEQRLLRATKTPVKSVATKTIPPGPGRVPPRVGQPQTQVPEPEDTTFQDVMDEQGKELALYREVVRRGLSMEDVEEIEFDDTVELQLKLDALEQQKEIESLKQAIAEGREPSSDDDPVSGPRIDTGGRSSAGEEQQVQRLEELDKTARDLKEEQRYTEASWVALRRAHADPSKVSTVRPDEVMTQVEE